MPDKALSSAEKFMNAAISARHRLKVANPSNLPAATRITPTAISVSSFLAMNDSPRFAAEDERDRLGVNWGRGAMIGLRMLAAAGKRAIRLGRLGALFLVSPVLAQSVNTTCTQTGIFTNCNSQYSPPPPAPDYSGFAALARVLAERRARKAAEQQAAQQASQTDAFNEQIAGLVQSGRCSEASATAIRAGRYDVASTVNQVCREPSPQQTPSPSKPAPILLPTCYQTPRPDPCQPY